MTDQENQAPEPRFDDPVYDDLRALLADARETGPVPADVVARLDQTLATLTADRRGAVPEADSGDGAGTVVPLRRRSRVGSRLLAAAAAVIVVGAGGVGISQVLGSQDAADLATAESAPEPSSDDGFGPAAPEAGSPREENLAELDALTARLSNSGVVPQFTSAGFADEVAALRSRTAYLDSSGRTPVADEGTVPELSPPTSGGSASGPDPGTDGDTAVESQQRSERVLRSYKAAKAACPGPVGIAAALTPVRFDGRPAALAVYPATEDGQRYEAWSCDGTTLLASTVVPR